MTPTMVSQLSLNRPARIRTIAMAVLMETARRVAELSIDGAGDECAQDAPAVQRVGRHQIQQRDVEVRPHQAARQISGVQPWPTPQIDAAAHGSDDGGGQTCEGKIDERTYDGEADLPCPGAKLRSASRCALRHTEQRR